MEENQMPEGGKNRRFMSIGRKVGYVVMLLQAVSGILAVFVCVQMFSSLVTGIHKEQCTNGTNMLALELERAEEGTDMNQILDELKNRKSEKTYCGAGIAGGGRMFCLFWCLLFF